MIEEGLVLRLRRDRVAKAATLDVLPVSSRRGGLLPCIDGTHNELLLDAADEE
jgi:hypothetical protein